MRLVIQRVDSSTITINDHQKRSISKGLLVLLGITHEDDKTDIDWLVRKLINLRIFPDESGVMNQSVQDISGDILLVSQFTLFASTRKGNRPSYLQSAPPDISIPLYEHFVDRLKSATTLHIETGEFGAHMSIELVNNGPVTIMIDSKNRV